MGRAARYGGLFEFNSFGYALLAAIFGSSAARSLWLILFGAVATIFSFAGPSKSKVCSRRR